MRRSAATLVLVCSAVAATPALARTTVAVAPLGTTSGQEYQWIGPALADALSLRIHRQDDLNAVTVRQVNAAMRQGNFDVMSLADEKVACRLGLEVGADLFVTGTYTAAWPDIEVMLVIVDPRLKKVVSTQTFTADLDQIADVEAKAALALSTALGAKTPQVIAGAFGTKELRAWRSTTLAKEIINWQSLAPRAADPNAPLALPKEALASAVGHLQDALKSDPDYGEAWATLGVTQALMNDTKAAWQSLGKATAASFGHDPTAVLGAAFVRMREGNWDGAAQILKDGITRHPGFLHARGYLGELYNHQGRHKEALAVFEEYARVAPHHPWVLTQLGYTKSKLGDHAGAIADTIAAVDALPESPSMLVQLASRYIDAKKLAGAEDALQHALKLFPNDATIYVRLGYVYLLQGREDLAIPISEKALKLAPLAEARRDIGYAHLNLARAYGHKGDLDQAFLHLTQAKAHGIGSFAEVVNDPGLDKLRKDPRYAKGGF
jgi:tetratricopeptide (TPR) repeat protein